MVQPRQKDTTHKKSTKVGSLVAMNNENKTEDRFQISSNNKWKGLCSNCILSIIETCYICQYVNCLDKGALIRIDNEEQKHD